ncbi:MAG: hypothetical protein NXY57DRAFT_1024130 [Lentinula lateritia]|nr:MAG: hypothetical protein NXY57DRAFT_1024130 [Lentinula lateritia]
MILFCLFSNIFAFALITSSMAVNLPLRPMTQPQTTRPSAQSSSQTVVGFLQTPTSALSRELNTAGTLTAALTRAVEENRYGRLQNECGVLHEPTEIICVIYAPTAAIEQVPKHFIQHQGPIHNKFEQSAIDREIENEGFEPAQDVILFNRSMSALSPNEVTMLIPHRYLVKSRSKPTHPFGENSLQLRVSCSQIGDYKGPRMVNWGKLWPDVSFPPDLRQAFNGIHDWYENQYY